MLYPAIRAGQPGCDLLACGRVSARGNVRLWPRTIRTRPTRPSSSSSSQADPKADPKKDPPRRDDLADVSKQITGPAGNPECVWLGRRVVHLLWRDDLDTAFRHLDLYDRFGCPGGHIQATFRCVVKQGPIDPKATDSLQARVHSCWINPAAPPARRGCSRRTGDRNIHAMTALMRIAMQRHQFAMPKCN